MLYTFWELSKIITQMVTISPHLTDATHTKYVRLSLINSVLKRCFFQFVNRILADSGFNFSVSSLCIYFHLFPSFQGMAETRGVLRRSLFSQPPLSSQDPPPVLHTAFNFLNDVCRLVSSRVCREMHPRNERERERESTISRYLLWPRFNVWSPP
jgi:hypothetical protein